MLRIILIFVFVLNLFSYFSFALNKKEKPLNIIFFIGDGMGLSQITAGKITKGNLNLEEFKTIGLMMTNSRSDLVTDSAAAGTALATGYKTYNGAISVSVNKKPLKTVVEYAEEKGKSTGLVTSCSVTHATPAVFFAHVKSRDEETLIAEQFVKSGVDLFFGGGWGYFVPESEKGSARDDEKNLLAELGKKMKVIKSADEFFKLKAEKRVVGFFASKHPPKASKRKPSLADLTSKAIKVLSQNKKGFFLMVEGSQIDWAGHRNNAKKIISETIDFDEAVGAGFDFAKKNQRTLILVTADHETGGFAIHDGSCSGKKVSKTGFTSRNHTATMVPLFAYGPGEENFGGILDNTTVGKKMIQFVKK